MTPKRVHNTRKRPGTVELYTPEQVYSADIQRELTPLPHQGTPQSQVFVPCTPPVVDAAPGHSPQVPSSQVVPLPAIDAAQDHRPQAPPPPAADAASDYRPQVPPPPAADATPDHRPQAPPPPAIDAAQDHRPQVPPPPAADATPDHRPQVPPPPAADAASDYRPQVPPPPAADATPDHRPQAPPPPAIDAAQDHRPQVPPPPAADAGPTSSVPQAYELRWVEPFAKGLGLSRRPQPQLVPVDANSQTSSPLNRILLEHRTDRERAAFHAGLNYEPSRAAFPNLHQRIADGQPSFRGSLSGEDHLPVSYQRAMQTPGTRMTNDFLFLLSVIPEEEVGIASLFEGMATLERINQRKLLEFLRKAADRLISERSPSGRLHDLQLYRLGRAMLRRLEIATALSPVERDYEVKAVVKELRFLPKARVFRGRYFRDTDYDMRPITQGSDVLVPVLSRKRRVAEESQPQLAGPRVKKQRNSLNLEDLGTVERRWRDNHDLGRNHYSYRKIADEIGKNRGFHCEFSNITKLRDRFVRDHPDKLLHEFRALQAIEDTRNARARSGRNVLLENKPALLCEVLIHLFRRWSPRRMEEYKDERGKKKFPSAGAITGFLDREELQKSILKAWLPMRGKMPLRQIVRVKGTWIPEDRTYQYRDPVAGARIEEGHWEGDTLIPVGQHGAILVCVEKVTRIIRAIYLPSKDSRDMMEAMAWVLGIYKVFTMTVDQGTEFRYYDVVEGAVGCTFTYCDPKSPTQKAQVEERIKRIREWISKRCDVRGNALTPAILQWELDEICWHINQRSMRVHKGKAPLDFHDDILKEFWDFEV